MNSTQQATDQQIQRAIVKAFDWAANIAAEHIGVAVTDGAVTLSGEAVNAVERDAALRLATRVTGVAAVVDEIELHGSPITPAHADIARGVAAVLDGQSANGEIAATVHDSRLTLTGTVAEPDQRDAVERAVRAVPGVHAVVNDIRVLPHPDGDETRQQVAAALRRGVESEIDHLVIDIHGHRATLGGSVHSDYERRAAERAARSVPGITDVDNQLDVAF